MNHLHESTPLFEARLRHRIRNQTPDDGPSDTFELESSLSLGRELGVLFGPSGSGKSLTLRLIAGLLRPDAGELRLNSETLCGPGVWTPPRLRRIGYVFQHHSLFPHMNVQENILYGARSLPPEEARSACASFLKSFRLEGLENRRPSAISGGQRQRVALARALIGKPRLLLLDEPFSALDQPTRVRIRECLAGVMRELGIPVLLVTHDLPEAVALADRMFVMSSGRIVQQGAPRDILASPASEEIRELLALDARR